MAQSLPHFFELGKNTAFALRQTVHPLQYQVFFLKIATNIAIKPQTGFLFEDDSGLETVIFNSFFNLSFIKTMTPP
jgi:hypothetical protein